mmetsp:Transcript_36434/g.66745  ORF Transcript_36434/g.66745 Transcript_36434/m.66745 type:complete len:475 (+) Transcript_36434:83-1507(+)
MVQARGVDEFPHGSHARIHGLSAKPELNDTFCVSRGVNPQNTDRLQVITSDGVVRSIKPANLTRVELKAGCAVTVVGLVSSQGQSYNGKTGEMLKLKPNGRWIVDLDDDLTLSEKSFQPENIVPMQEMPEVFQKRTVEDIDQEAQTEQEKSKKLKLDEEFLRNLPIPGQLREKAIEVRRPETKKELLAMSEDELAALAKSLRVNVAGCNRPGVLAVLLTTLKLEDPKPPPQPAANEALPVEEENKPKDAWTRRKEMEEYKESVYKHFQYGFQVGDRWELLKSVVLYDAEVGRDTCHFMESETKSGWRNVIEIVELGGRRLKVRGTYWDRMSSMLLSDKSRQGWLDITSAVNQETGELMMKLSRPQGSATGDGTGEAGTEEDSWVFAPKERRQGRLVVHPQHGCGLELIATPHGMRVAEINALPGQPHLAVGDVITKIKEVDLRGLPKSEEVEEAFGGALADNAYIEIAAMSKRE